MINMDREAIARMRAITISREYGSGGGEIAARLAKLLEWQLIDHEVIVRMAQELGVSEAEAEAHDEYTEDLFSRIIRSFSVMQPTLPVALPAPLTTDSHAYYEARRRVVEGAYAAGHVVIVGRGAQVLLAEHRDVLHVRIVAALEQRITYVMQREGLDQAEAQTRIQIKDRDRIHFLQAEHHQHPEDAHLYDLVVNTSVLDLESVIDLILFSLERKARRLSIPTGELGPGVGLARYPETPGDFHAPEETSESST